MGALADAKVIPIPTRAEDGFRLTAEQLRAAITPRTKLLVLPFPNNPTGAVMRREHLEEIADVLRGTDIIVLSDEIYAEMTFGRERHVSIAEIDGMKRADDCGQRLFQSLCHDRLAVGLCRQTGANFKADDQNPSICHYVRAHYQPVRGGGGLRHCDDEIEAMVVQYDMRRRLLVDSLNQMGLSCFSPEGAFYVFPVSSPPD